MIHRGEAADRLGQDTYLKIVTTAGKNDHVANIPEKNMGYLGKILTQSMTVGNLHHFSMPEFNATDVKAMGITVEHQNTGLSVNNKTLT